MVIPFTVHKDVVGYHPLGAWLVEQNVQGSLFKIWTVYKPEILNQIFSSAEAIILFSVINYYVPLMFSYTILTIDEVQLNQGLRFWNLKLHYR